MTRPYRSAIISGLILALAFPRIEWSACAWFALVPLFRAISGETPARAFRIGWVSGMAFTLATLYWVAIPIAHYSAISGAFAVGPLLLLCAALSVYTGAFTAGVRTWETRTGRDGLWIACFLWVAVEWIRSSWLLPFPWNLLGYSQYRSINLIQMAEVTGIYGPGALIVAVNWVLHSVIIWKDVESRGLAVRLGVVTLALSLAYGFGAWRLAASRDTPGDHHLRAGLVQPAIDPKLKWEPSERLSVLETQELLSLPLAQGGADLVIWPEASAPYVFAPDTLYALDPEYFRQDRELRDRMVDFARDLGVALVFGSPALASERAGRGAVWNSLNRAFLISPQGRIEAQYDKMILVPFGEYVPLSRALFFLDKLVPGVGSFIPGSDPTIFRIPQGRFAVLICYEAIFPDFVRRFVARGAKFLVNVTNDAWFGDTSGPGQHLAMAAVRAVENRTPVIRVANAGISAVIDADGRIREKFPLFHRASRLAEIRWSDRVTLYTRYGDVFAQTAALAALLMLVYAGWVGPVVDASPVGLVK